MDKGLGQGEGVACLWDISARLPEEVETGAAFPLQAMENNLVRQHLGPLDALVWGPHKSDCNPTLDISACPWVRLPSLCCEATGYPFQGSHHLHTQQPFNGGDEVREMLALLEACLQVHLLLRPLRLLQTLFQCLRQMGLGICVNDVCAVNTVSPILPEVTDQEVTPLFRGL